MRFLSAFGLALVLSTSFAAVTSEQRETVRAGASFAPLELQCDSTVDPLGVDSAPPRLSWRLDGMGRGLSQIAWHVLVASSAEALAADRGDCWDSGKVASDEQVYVPYRGRALRSGEKVFWKVRVWDQSGATSAWSSVATWTMGLLVPEDWKGAEWMTDGALLRWKRDKFGYRSMDAEAAATTKWVQVDLGSPRVLETVRYRAIRYGMQEGFGFLRRFKVEGSNDPSFREATVIGDQTGKDFNPWLMKAEFPVQAAAMRYVRLTATLLRENEGKACLALSQIEAISEGKNVAVGSPVTASDSLENEQWSASALTDGIGVPGTNPRANGTLLLRREFVVRKNLRRAVAFVCGLGEYRMSINGERVGEGLLTPGWTNYDKTCLYDTHDVTTRLQAGPNAIGLVLAGGMYNVQDGRYTKFVTAFRPLVAKVQLRLEYADGSVETVSSDRQWRVAAGPITFSQVYGGEDYDATLEPAGWDRTGFAETGWTPASPTAGPQGVLRGESHASPAFRRYETLTPVAVHEMRTGVTIYDLGQNASLMLRLRVHGPRGSKVKVIPAELLHADGTLDRGSAGGGEASWNYTLAGTGKSETWAPEFFYHGSRYLQVERSRSEAGELPEVEAIEASVAYSDSPADGDFACSNELFNRVRTLIRWAQRSNLSHVITDCPHRERLGWMEQYHLNGPSLRYEFDLTRLYSKTFNDMDEAQQPNGLLPSVAPEYVVFTDGFRDSPEWGSALVLAAWQHYEWTGDDTPLRVHYEAMRRYAAYLASRSKDRILSHGLGDWFDLGPARPGVAQLTPVPLTATAFFYEVTSTLAKIATRLGKTDDASLYAKNGEDIKRAFNQAFFNPALSAYASGSQTAQALPLVLDLVEPSKRDAVLAALVKDVAAHGNAVTAGDVGYRYVLRALASSGRSDVIFAMNNQSDKPGYGYQLAHGATSLTEAWDADPHASQNHFMLGQLTEWFYGNLAGIAPDPTLPGFKRVVIRPEPVEEVTWARANHVSAHGKTAVEWHHESGRFTLQVDVPPNTTAEIWMPAEQADEVKENDAPAKTQPGVHFVRTEPGRALYSIGSGHYLFSSARK